MLPFGARIFGFGRVVPIIGLWRRSRFENPVTACLAVALAKVGAETMPKSKKTAFFIYCTERLHHFLNRSRDLLRRAIPEKGEAISDRPNDNLT
jgi:hypothetical protein